MEVQKIKAFDEIFKETDVEEEVITQAFLEYKLSESQEFKDIISRTKTFIKEKTKESMEKSKLVKASKK